MSKHPPESTPLTSLFAKGAPVRDTLAWHQGLDLIDLADISDQDMVHTQLELLGFQDPEALRLRNLELVDGQVAAIIGKARWTKLRVIDIHNCPVGDATAQALAESGFSQLRKLNLCKTQISDYGLRLLSEEYGKRLNEFQGSFASATESGLLPWKTSGVPNIHALFWPSLSD